jgi:hypothetical protein
MKSAEVRLPRPTTAGTIPSEKDNPAKWSFMIAKTFFLV